MADTARGSSLKLEVGQEYEVATDTVKLWEEERAPCEELCILKPGSVIEVKQISANSAGGRLKVRYGSHVGWLDNAGSVLRPRKQKKTSIFGGLMGGGKVETRQSAVKKNRSGSALGGAIYGPGGGSFGVVKDDEKKKNPLAEETYGVLSKEASGVDLVQEEERGLCVEDGVYLTAGVCTLRAQEDLFSAEICDIQCCKRKEEIFGVKLVMICFF